MISYIRIGFAQVRGIFLHEDFTVFIIIPHRENSSIIVDEPWQFLHGNNDPIAVKKKTHALKGIVKMPIL